MLIAVEIMYEDQMQLKKGNGNKQSFEAALKDELEKRGLTMLDFVKWLERKEGECDFLALGKKIEIAKLAEVKQ